MTAQSLPGTRCILVVFGLILFTSVVWAQSAPPDPLLDAPVPSFVVRNATILDAVSALSRMSLGIGFALEQDSSVQAEEPRLSLELRNTSLREVMDNLCARDSRYKWALHGRTVNFVPRQLADDPNYFLNRTIASAQITNALDAGDAMLTILGQLPGFKDAVAYGQWGGSIAYPAPWTTTMKNLTAREALNLAAAHLGNNAGWVLSTSQGMKMFNFFPNGFTPPKKK